MHLGSLLADKTEGLTDPDDAPPVPEHPVSQTGDLWLLGRHRLLCGDSTVATDVERVLGGVEPLLMDPAMLADRGRRTAHLLRPVEPFLPARDPAMLADRAGGRRRGGGYTGCAPRAVPIAELQAILLRQGAWLRPSSAGQVEAAK